MKAVGSILKIVAVGALLGASGYLVFTEAAPLFAVPCEKPILYTIGEYDERFGISKAELLNELSKAATLWNDAAGKQVVALASSDTKDALPVNLVYGTEQKTAELGKVIDSEQSAYDAKKKVVENLKSQYAAARAAYEKQSAAYERDAKSYESQVQYWNARGGAPKEEYDKLTALQKELEQDRRRLNDAADALNALGGQINDAVDALNALAGKLNSKVDTYNSRVGEDFDQGNYVSDSEGKRINIFEFANRIELERVLTHEFGHALGMDHVENPESIMYAYNIGTTFALSEEDIAALRVACRLDK